MQTTPQPAPLAFSIELRLEPNASGREALKNWPAAQITPDFIVATSGFLRLELDGQIPAVKAGRVLVIAKGIKEEEGNPWWPDYLGGFALNLGLAVLKLHTQAEQSRAAFVDEPTALVFQRQPNTNLILVAFEPNGQRLLTALVPETELRSQIRRALQDFVTQLLSLNPKLASQPDVQELHRQIQALV